VPLAAEPVPTTSDNSWFLGTLLPGDTPDLVTDIVMCAYDSFTDTNISVSHSDITTSLSSDPNVGTEDAVVKK
jgi:hypothetical protein